MSALRLGRLPDGTRHIVEDPSYTVGRVSFSRVGMRASGEYIVTSSAKYHTPDKRTGAHSPKVRGERLFVCGKTLKIIGGSCARRPGHRFDCKSAEALDRMASGRRSNTPRPV